MAVLAAEALKNLGFDAARPDRHVKRAMGSFGLVHVERWPGRNGRAAPSLTSRRLLLAAMTAARVPTRKCGANSSGLEGATCYASAPDLINDSAGMPNSRCRRQIILRLSDRLRFNTS